LFINAINENAYQINGMATEDYSTFDESSIP